jgi:glyoxylase-like metal-dependent hydrolase (beta-lactamase superfamily II)
MAGWPFTKGLHDLGNGCYAWLQPDGSWGYSNAGLIVDGKEALLVDTLFDLKLTREMLAGMRKAVPQAAQIGTLFNTHGNGDHTFGNQLVRGARIIATRGALQDMEHRPPAQLYDMTTKSWQALGEAGRFMYEMMGSRFDFSDIEFTPPTELFGGELTVSVGGKTVHLIELGPAHTRGDALAYVPADRTVFTGDLLFVGGHPIGWAGPMSNWIKACDRILSLDVDIVVPGHGPITDKAGVRTLKGYLEYTYAEARKRYDAGMTFEQAAQDIRWEAFRDWNDSERLLVNIETCYREFANDTSPRNVVHLWTLMARWRKQHESGHAHAPHDEHAGHGH